MAHVSLYLLQEPIRWRAGYSGEGETRRELFFACGRCHEPDALIAGFEATGPTLDQVVVIRQPGTVAVHLALYCAKCFDERTAEIVAANDGAAFPPGEEEQQDPGGDLTEEEIASIRQREAEATAYLTGR